MKLLWSWCIVASNTKEHTKAAAAAESTPNNNNARKKETKRDINPKP